MNKRTIKKRFMRLDQLALPAMEKMLPPEALVKKEAPVIEKRRAFPRLAVASLAIVALVVATALVIGSVTGGNKKQIDPDNSLVLNNDSENTSIPSAEHTSTEESEATRKDMPIVSCGKFTSFETTSVVVVNLGEVALTTMKGGKKDIEKLQDDVLFAVCFAADFYESPEYIEETERIRKEYAEKESLGIPVDPIEKYKKIEKFYRTISEKLTPKMYEYLESLNIEFYDKTVYVFNSATNKLMSEEVYRIAFLTKEQIQSLKGGEDYGIRVTLVFEEMAKQDNEPVYLNEWYSVS
ncbi:MAG: hypothetical protein IJC49_07315 [Clostridia bacterium]|nr:hypothetical protein [Clostridia bacterium]